MEKSCVHTWANNTRYTSNYKSTRKILLVPSEQCLIFRNFCCSQSGNPSQKDLAKSGYTKYKLLIVLLYVWLHNENHIYESGDFYFFFPSFLANENLQKHFSSIFFNFYFNFWRYIAIKKKGFLGVSPMSSKPINWISQKIFFESYGLDQITLLIFHHGFCQ